MRLIYWYTVVAYRYHKLLIGNKSSKAISFNWINHINRQRKISEFVPSVLDIQSILVIMISTHITIPYSIEGFRDLMNTMEKRCTVPSRKFFTERIIPDIHQQVEDSLDNYCGLLEKIRSLPTRGLHTTQYSRIWESRPTGFRRISPGCHMFSTACH
jgi:hypothetical protein